MPRDHVAREFGVSQTTIKRRLARYAHRVATGYPPGPAQGIRTRMNESDPLAGVPDWAKYLGGPQAC
jgi:hypothetical protein